MRFIKKNFYKIILLAFLIIAPVLSYAGDNDVTCNPTLGKICNPLGSSGPNTVQDFIKLFVVEALKIGIPVVALAVIYSGFLFVEARGNSEKLDKAKGALWYTMIGAGILLGSWAIAELISATVTGLGK